MSRDDHEAAPLTTKEYDAWKTIVEETGRVIPLASPERRAEFIVNRELYLIRKQREKDGDA